MTEPALPSGVELTLDHQQVLAFASTYLHEYGCLPTAGEAALACGFRSSRTASRLLDELEGLGVVQRDERYSRLGSIDLTRARLGAGEAASQRDQLWLCRRACIEYEAALAALRFGLGVAPGIDEVAALHAEGVARATVLRSFHDACRRLEEGGARLDEVDLAALCEQEEIARSAHALLVDWGSFTVVRLVWNLSAQQWLATIDPLLLGYAGSAFVASLRTIRPLLPTYAAWARPALAAEPATALFDALAELLGGLRRGLARHHPGPPEQLHVDVGRLLVTELAGLRTA